MSHLDATDLIILTVEPLPSKRSSWCSLIGIQLNVKFCSGGGECSDEEAGCDRVGGDDGDGSEGCDEDRGLFCIARQDCETDNSEDLINLYQSKSY